jgi:hypothetical protein
MHSLIYRTSNLLFNIAMALESSQRFAIGIILDDLLKAWNCYPQLTITILETTARNFMRWETYTSSKSSVLAFPSSTTAKAFS